MPSFKSILFGLLATLCVAACTYTAKIKDGETAYQQKQYAKAAPMLIQSFRKEKETVRKAQLAYLAAQSYSKTNQIEKALEWYKTAYKTKATDKTAHAYAFALKQNGMYAEAMDIFKDLNAEAMNDYNYKKQIQACQNAVQWEKAAEKNPYQIQAVSWNTAQSEYAPTLYQDGKLIITSDRIEDPKADKFLWTGNAFSDFYVVDGNSITPFDNHLNSEYNEGTIAFNKDFTQAIFSSCGTNDDEDSYCRLMVSEKQGSSWTTPKVLPFVMNGVNYAHPSWSPNGKALYFAANLRDGWGGYDIYKIHYSAPGWGEPQILSAVINTRFDEMFPTWNGDTLYFSSKGHGGMGGLDILRSSLTSKQQWTKPQNLKAPINSAADDFHLIITQKMKGNIGDIIQKGYFSSSRAGGKGNDDIYTFTKKKEKPKPQPKPVEQPVVTTTPQPNRPTPPQTTPSKPKAIVLEMQVLGKVYSNPNDPKSSTSKVVLPNANLQILSNGQSETVKTDTQGKYVFNITQNIDYRIFASSSDYYNQSTRFNTVTRGAKDIYQITITLDKILRNVEINLDNIYYDYNKWDIREDAKPTLNTLANTLRQNPSIQIILGSHTDCRGKERYNQELSQKRAQSAVDYLVSQGIEPNRLQATGYGESAPVTTCDCKACSEEEHQQNRRTTFLIR